MTRFLRLSQTFDPGQLCTDLQSALQAHWTRHVNAQDYRGEWTGVALRSASGAAGDLLSVPGIEVYRNTPVLKECPYFQSILDGFAFDMETVRLLRLAPGSEIREHRDRGASYAEGFVRLHIPITTNADTRFIVDGVVLPMQPGECWYADFTLLHSVRNDGATDRVHLIIDGIRNAWSDQLFAAAGYDFAAETRARQMPSDTRRQVIAELRTRGDRTSLDLAAALEAEGSADR